MKLRLKYFEYKFRRNTDGKIVKGTSEEHASSLKMLDVRLQEANVTEFYGKEIALLHVLEHEVIQFKITIPSIVLTSNYMTSDGVVKLEMAEYISTSPATFIRDGWKGCLEKIVFEAIDDSDNTKDYVRYPIVSKDGKTSTFIPMRYHREPCFVKGMIVHVIDRDTGKSSEHLIPINQQFHLRKGKFIAPYDLFHRIDVNDGKEQLAVRYKSAGFRTELSYCIMIADPYIKDFEVLDNTHRLQSGKRYDITLECTLVYNGREWKRYQRDKGKIRVLKMLPEHLKYLNEVKQK